MLNMDVDNNVYRIVSNISFKAFKNDVKFYKKKGYDVCGPVSCNLWGHDIIFHQILLAPNANNGKK